MQLNFSAGIGTNYYNISGVENASFSSQWHQNFNKYLQFSLSIPLFNRFDTRNKVKPASSALLYHGSWKKEKALFKEIQQAYYNAVAAESKYKSSNTATDASSFLPSDERKICQW